MTNIAAGFEAAGQGLGQVAGLEMQKEMMQAQMMRAENLALLRDALTTRRQLAVTGARGQILASVAHQRTSDEHAARDEEIDRENAGRGQNQATSQRRQLINTEAAQDNAARNAEHLQNSGFDNRLELQGRQGRVQAYRSAMVQAQQARQAKATIRTWLTNYQKQNAMFSANPGGGIDMQGLAQAAQHDTVLASQLRAYKEADAREQSAQQTMGSTGSPYVMAPGASATAPAGGNGNSQSSGLIPIEGDTGPGIGDQPYPSDSGADMNFMSSPTDDGGDGSQDDGSGEGQ